LPPRRNSQTRKADSLTVKEEDTDDTEAGWAPMLSLGLAD